MKRFACHFRNLVAAILLVSSSMGFTAQAGDITVYDSVVSLASNITKNYTFTDPDSGAAVVIALTMTPYSTNQAETFSFLDGSTRLGIGIDGDGNWIEPTEGVNFVASLVSTSGDIDLASIGFRIAGLGMRSAGNNYIWTSNSGSVTNGQSSGESVKPLDAATTALNGTTYAGTLRSTTERYQLSNNGALAGQGLVLNAVFQTNAAPRFANPQIMGSTTNHFEATLFATPGQIYEIYYSADLAQWTFLTEVTATPNGVVFSDPDAESTARFYQVRPLQ